MRIEDSSYKLLSDGTYEVSVTVKSKRFSTAETGEMIPTTINEPIQLGVFTEHPSTIKEDNSILYYASNQISQERSEIKIIVKKKPTHIAIDPFGTRSDENLIDNIVAF